MDQSDKWEGMRLDTPATYRIKVQGRLDDRWTERLGGMVIISEVQDNRATFTILEGHLPDQAALKLKMTPRQHKNPKTAPWLPGAVLGFSLKKYGCSLMVL